MPRRPPLTPALLAALALSGVALSGCGTDPDTQGVSVPSVDRLSTATLVACRSLKADLPTEIAPGAVLRTVSPLSDTTAAWGSPPITLRCGVPAGSPRDDPYTFNGVAWAMHDDGDSRLWTTLGRKVNVVVEVPDAYSSQAELIGRLATAVNRALR